MHSSFARRYCRMSCSSLASQFHKTLWLMPTSTHMARADLPKEMPAKIVSSNSGVFRVGAPLFLRMSATPRLAPPIFDGCFSEGAVGLSASGPDSLRRILCGNLFSATVHSGKQFDLASGPFLDLGSQRAVDGQRIVPWGNPVYRIS